MDVLIADECGRDTLLDADEVRAACAAVLAVEGIARPCEVSVTFVDEERIRELNAAWRAVDQVTDVLSFPCDDPADDMLPFDEPVELGDIVLCPAQIERQAPSFGMTPAAECRIMLVHGMLHLLGYDHMAEDEAFAMEERERVVLRTLAEARGEDPSAVELGPMTRHEDEGRPQ